MADELQTDSYYGGAQADDSGPSIVWYYIGILRRRIWVILPVVIIFATFGLIRGFRAQKIYEGTAKLLVERQMPQLMHFEYGLQNNSGWDPDFYSTQTELIRSRAVMELALVRPEIKQIFEAGDDAADSDMPESFLSEVKRTLVSVLGATPAPPPEPWEVISGQLTTRHVEDTHFLEVSCIGASPSHCARMANAAAEAFQEYHRQRKVETLGAAFIALQKEKEKEELELLKAEKELQDFREGAEALSVESTQDQPAIERLNRLNDQLTEVQLSRIELSAQIGVMQDVLEGRGGLAKSSEERLFSITEIQDNRDLSEERQGLADAEKELAELVATYGEQHPRLVAARANVELIKTRFKAALTEIMNSQLNRLQMFKQQEAELSSEYDAQKLVALSLAKESFTYTRLMHSVDRHRRLFDSLVERMREVDVSSSLVQTNVQIIERAPVPTIPIGAGKLQILFLSVCIGLFLGGGLAFLIENLDDTVKTPEDLRERLDIPLLGFIPSITGDETDIEDGDMQESDGDHDASEPFRDVKPTWRERIHSLLREFIPSLEEPSKPTSPVVRAHRGRIVLTEPMSSVAEAYRSIRASLFYSTPADEMKLLSITSCRPQEGKTTTSCNMSLCIAQTGKKVLLIDGDLHRPSVHRTLGIENGRGLTSVLVGECEWREALSRVFHEGAPVESLDILTAGPQSLNPSELLNSNRMKELIATVSEIYDWIIIDTPPVLFVSDARILSVMSDGVLVVVKAGSSTRSLLARTREQLAIVNARVIGSVLNNVRVSRMGRHYSSYYAYGYSRYAKDYKSYYYQEGDEEAGEEGATTSSEKPRRKKRSSSEERQPGARVRSRPMTPLQQAVLHLDAGNPGRARALLMEQLETSPDLLEGWEVLFEVAYQQKEPEELEKNLGKYREARGAQGHVNALGEGYLALLSGDVQTAGERFEEALAMKPKNARSLEAALRVDLMLGDADAADRRVSVLLEQDPGNAYGNYVRGTLCLVEGQLEEAEVALRKSLKTKRSPEALNDLAHLLHEKELLNEAEDMARSALEMDARIPQVWDTLGHILLSMGRIDDAERALERAHALDPEDIGTVLCLAELNVQKGNGERAVEFVDKLSGKMNRLSQNELNRAAQVKKAAG